MGHEMMGIEITFAIGIENMNKMQTFKTFYKEFLKEYKCNALAQKASFLIGQNLLFSFNFLFYFIFFHMVFNSSSLFMLSPFMFM